MTGHEHNMTIVTVGPIINAQSLNYRKFLQLYTIVTLTFYDWPLREPHRKEANHTKI